MGPSVALPTKEAAVLRGHEGAVLAVRFNHDGKYCLSCGKDRTLRLWNPHNGLHIKTYSGHARDVRDVAVSRYPNFSLFWSSFFLKSRDLYCCHLFCDFFFCYSFCTQLSYSSMNNDFESCLLRVVVTKVTMQSWAHVEVIASFSIGMSPLVVSSASFEAMTVRCASSPTLTVFSTHMMRLVLWVHECIRTGSPFLPTCLSWHSSWTFYYLSLWLTVLRSEQVQLKGFRVLLL